MNDKTLKTMFSSATDLWSTPQPFFDRLDAEFGFTLDPCSDGTNNKCAKYFTAADDGLAQDWAQEIVFMNPPYQKPEQPCKRNCTKKKCKERGYHIDKYVPGIADWIRKAYEESRKGATVVALIPSRTETTFWCDYVMKAEEIRFVKGRIKFGDGSGPAPFPSAVVVFRGNGEVDGEARPKINVMEAVI